jgi:NitT/TauT family transport system ATP-binding protein
MTFPFSNHNYQLRFWMAAGGLDPDEDVRLVVLPPPYKAERLANGHVDGFCVGAPWNSVAVDLGMGRILHFASDIVARESEKVLAIREVWATENPDALQRLLRALARAAAFVEENRQETAGLLARPGRIGVSAEIIHRTLSGHLKLAPGGALRSSDRYILIGRDGASRPDPVQAAWIYAQMVRWGQAPLSQDSLATAKGVFRPGLFDAALGSPQIHSVAAPADGIGAFAGPSFDPSDLAKHLSEWRVGRPR